jgi:hypothetical protein
VNSSNGSAGDRVAAALSGARIGEGVQAKPRFVVRRIDASGRTEMVRDSIVNLIGLRHGPLDAPDGLLVLTEEAVSSGKLRSGSNVTSCDECVERTLEPVLREERLHWQGGSIGGPASVRLT